MVRERGGGLNLGIESERHRERERFYCVSVSLTNAHQFDRFPTQFVDPWAMADESAKKIIQAPIVIVRSL